jgi:hypothetical protein
MIALLVFPASPLFMAPRILPFAFDSLAAAVVPRGLRFLPGGLRFLPGGLGSLPGGLGSLPGGLRFVVSTTLTFMVSRTIFGVPRILFGVPRILPFMVSRTLFVAPGSLLFIARGILRFVVFVVRFVAREALSVLVRGSPATIDSPPVDRAAAVRVWADSLVVRCAGHQPRVV